MAHTDKRVLLMVDVVPARSQCAAVLTATFSSLPTRAAGRPHFICDNIRVHTITRHYAEITATLAESIIFMLS